MEWTYVNNSGAIGILTLREQLLRQVVMDARSVGYLYSGVIGLQIQHFQLRIEQAWEGSGIMIIIIIISIVPIIVVLFNIIIIIIIIMNMMTTIKINCYFSYRLRKHHLTPNLASGP